METKERTEIDDECVEAQPPACLSVGSLEDDELEPLDTKQKQRMIWKTLGFFIGVVGVLDGNKRLQTISNPERCYIFYFTLSTSQISPTCSQQIQDVRIQKTNKTRMCVPVCLNEEEIKPFGYLTTVVDVWKKDQQSSSTTPSSLCADGFWIETTLSSILGLRQACQALFFAELFFAESFTKNVSTDVHCYHDERIYSIIRLADQLDCSNLPLKLRQNVQNMYARFNTALTPESRREIIRLVRDQHIVADLLRSNPHAIVLRFVEQACLERPKHTWKRGIGLAQEERKEYRRLCSGDISVQRLNRNSLIEPKVQSGDIYPTLFNVSCPVDLSNVRCFLFLTVRNNVYSDII